MKTIIHVNQHVIRRNAKTGSRDPVLTIKAGKSNTYAHSVEIQGPSVVVYSPDKPLSCGARCWIETHSPVVIHAPEAPPVSRRRSAAPRLKAPQEATT